MHDNVQFVCMDHWLKPLEAVKKLGANAFKGTSTWERGKKGALHMHIYDK